MSVRVEYQDAGLWFSSCLIDGTPSDMSVLLEMRRVKSIYPDKRVRAVDAETGRLVDILPD